MIHATSSLLPTNSDLDCLFAFSFTIPKTEKDLQQFPVVCNSENLKCAKCDSYILQDQKICPICSPNIFYLVKDSLMLKSFMIKTQNTKKFTRTVLLVLDLNISQKELKSFLELFIADADKRFYSDILFYISFLGSSLSFVNIESGSISFSIVHLDDDIEKYGKSISEFTDLMDKMIETAKRFLIQEKDKTSSLEDLFCFLENHQVGKNIDNVILLFTGNLTPNLVQHASARFHLIELANNSLKENVEIALKCQLSYIFQSSISRSTLLFCKSVISEVLTQNNVITIKYSTGAYVRESNGPFQLIAYDNEYRGVAFKLNFFSEQIPPVFNLKLEKNYNIFSSHETEFYSIQIIYNFSPKFTIIINEAWKCTNNAQTWLKSVSIPSFSSYFLQKRAYERLKIIFPQTISQLWKIHNRKYRIPRQIDQNGMFKKYISSIEESFELLMKQQFLQEDQKLLILLLIYYGNYAYIDAFIHVILDSPITDDYAYIPPFIFINDRKKSPEKMPLSYFSTTIKKEPETIIEINEFINNCRINISLSHPSFI